MTDDIDSIEKLTDELSRKQKEILLRHLVDDITRSEKSAETQEFVADLFGAGEGADRSANTFGGGKLGGGD